MAQRLDFTKLPTDESFNSRSMWATVPQTLQARLTPLPQTLERLQAAVMFAELSAKQREPQCAAAFVRAALAEFLSMGDMQKIDSPRSTGLHVIDLDDPLLHLLKLLRDLNIHANTIRAVPHSVAASFDDQDLQLNVFVLSNLQVADLANLKNGHHYSMPDLRMMITWLEKAQLHWGAGYVIRKGAESFAEAICTHHGY